MVSINPDKLFHWKNQEVMAETFCYSSKLKNDCDFLFYIDGVKTITRISTTNQFWNYPSYIFTNLSEEIHTVKVINSGGIESECTFTVDYSTISFDSDGGTDVEPLQYTFEDYNDYIE